MMSINSTTYTERSGWAYSSYASQAAAFGSVGQAAFAEDLDNASEDSENQSLNLGFGAAGQDGSVVSSIKAITASDELLGHLQLAFLQQQNTNGLDSRLNNTLFK